MQPRLVSNSQSSCLSLSGTVIVSVCQEAGFWDLLPVALHTHPKRAVRRNTVCMLPWKKRFWMQVEECWYPLSSLWAWVHFNTSRILRVQNEALKLLDWIGPYGTGHRTSIAQALSTPSWSTGCTRGLVFCFCLSESPCLTHFAYLCDHALILKSVYIKGICLINGWLDTNAHRESRNVKVSEVGLGMREKEEVYGAKFCHPCSQDLNGREKNPLQAWIHLIHI